jgi:hypothetical protein
MLRNPAFIGCTDVLEPVTPGYTEPFYVGRRARDGFAACASSRHGLAGLAAKNLKMR